ncbi:hypothetical protein DPMN_034931 [Dreissena polymorpha]|uniref:Uncharacterized protein n=1 Tax=Dreissena polymorpha TaxID=45954 RepID=A0A9D4M9K6_DREPO|nr:hypothetical protein DPMN_034931 [Dreissena polymorpha]
MRPKKGPMPSTNPPASVKLLASASLKLLVLRHPKALGEASVTAMYDVRRLQPSEDPLTIQQELRSPGSTVRSQRKHPNTSERCSFRVTSLFFRCFPARIHRRTL